jgi:hypothetical protein
MPRIPLFRRVRWAVAFKTSLAYSKTLFQKTRKKEQKEKKNVIKSEYVLILSFFCGKMFREGISNEMTFELRHDGEEEPALQRSGGKSYKNRERKWKVENELGILK